MIRSVLASTLMSFARSVSFLDKSEQTFEEFVLEFPYNVMNWIQSTIINHEQFSIIGCYLATAIPWF